jgi:choline-sulfatase
MPAKRPPNVLIIMSDQHHPRFLGGVHPFLQTPAMDALAARGTRFSSAYCSFPLCCPSRMSFMSGRYASRVNCNDNLAQLASDVPTFAHGFLASDYNTLLCGRMHFVGEDQRHGFETRLVSDVTTAYVNVDWALRPVLGDFVDTPGYSRQGLLKSGPGNTGYHDYDRAVCDNAVRWLRERGDQQAERPFMMVVGFASPHCPFIAPPEDYELYDKLVAEADLPDPHLDKVHPLILEQRRMARIDDEPAVPKAAQRRARVAYLGLCTFLDRLVGNITGALAQAGLAEDTIVVYTSDHGEQLGEHGLWWKTTFYEGSVGVPLIMAGPGVPAGKVCGKNVSVMDIGPTVLDMAGAAALPDTDGRSFRCLLGGDEAAWDDEVIAECISAWAKPPAMRMVKRGPWKYCHYHGGAAQLFNLAVDPDELCDRVADPACAEIVAQLRARALRDWDGGAIERQLKVREREVALIREWHKRVKPAEPDPLWFGSPPQNWADMTR